jgi:8-oxo-dGTP pyrophosphatase MutT (NUDIX family)
MPFTIRRPAARCVLLDGAGRIFLIRAEDPIDPHKPEWLEVPGGGIGYGEDSATACRRELREETGIVDVEIGPCVWTQYVEYTFAGFRFESDDRIHVAWCDGGVYAPKGLEALEAEAFISATWWSLADLLGSDEPTVPVRLREFLPAVVSGEIPTEPIDITPLGPDHLPLRG